MSSKSTGPRDSRNQKHNINQCSVRIKTSPEPSLEYWVKKYAKDMRHQLENDGYLNSFNILFVGETTMLSLFGELDNAARIAAHAEGVCADTVIFVRVGSVGTDSDSLHEAIIVHGKTRSAQYTAVYEFTGDGACPIFYEPKYSAELSFPIFGDVFSPL